MIKPIAAWIQPISRALHRTTWQQRIVLVVAFVALALFVRFRYLLMTTTRSLPMLPMSPSTTAENTPPLQPLVQATTPSQCSLPTLPMSPSTTAENTPPLQPLVQATTTSHDIRDPQPAQGGVLPTEGNLLTTTRQRVQRHLRELLNNHEVDPNDCFPFLAQTMIAACLAGQGPPPPSGEGADAKIAEWNHTIQALLALETRMIYPESLCENLSASAPSNVCLKTILVNILTDDLTQLKGSWQAIHDQLVKILRACSKKDFEGVGLQLCGSPDKQPLGKLGELIVDATRILTQLISHIEKYRAQIDCFARASDSVVGEQDKELVRAWHTDTNTFVEVCGKILAYIQSVFWLHQMPQTNTGLHQLLKEACGSVMRECEAENKTRIQSKKICLAGGKQIPNWTLSPDPPQTLQATLQRAKQADKDLSEALEITEFLKAMTLCLHRSPNATKSIEERTKHYKDALLHGLPEKYPTWESFQPDIEALIERGALLGRQ